MRLEATIPDTRYAQLSELADELQVPKSTLVEEALSVLLTGLIEARHGRRFAIIDPATQRVISQVATPLLMQLEWATHREKVSLSRTEAGKLEDLLENPPAPTPRLRKAMARRARTPVT